MDINIDITKVFGQEMAKIFAESLTEEELKNAANN